LDNLRPEPAGSLRACWIAGLLALYAVALAWQAWHVGITFDEPSHLVRAYTYWQGQDVLPPPDTTPLVWMVGGWVPHALKAPVAQQPGWKTRSSWDLAQQMLEPMPAAEARRLFYLTRLTSLVFPLATVWLVWHWARQLFSERTALAVAACAVLEPTLMGHGSLLKSDAAATFGCLLASYCGWRYWRQPDLRRVAGFACGILIAILAKYSLVILPPVALALILWRGPRRWGVPLFLLITYLGLLAGYQFQTRRFSGDLALFQAAGFSRAEIAAARVIGRLPWPAQFIEGIRYLGAGDRQDLFPAYMLGRKIEGNAPGYFPFAWAVKFPIPLQILTLAGLVALGARLHRRQTTSNDAFVWLPPALVLAAAMRSHIHMGFRHIMPVIPFLLLGGGFALERWGRRRAFRAAAVVLGLWLVAASARIYPQGISYFNEWAGGPEDGWKYLADSNLDWGQNLPELARYVAENGIAQVKLHYFGNDIPAHYLPPEKLDLQAAPWGPEWEREFRLEPAPGVYAISVNTLLGFFYTLPYRDYFAYFKAREPDAKAGYSIFIYYVR
jgi:hypothetical protein